MTVWRYVRGSELRPGDEGREVMLAGWVARRRDLGGLVFVDLRDGDGVLQVVINPDTSPAAAEVAHQLRNEFVVRTRGSIVKRAEDTVNPSIATGEIELQATELEILSRSTPLPFQLDALGVRGRLVRLGPALDAIIERHGYPLAVARPLAEAMTLCAALATSLSR